MNPGDVSALNDAIKELTKALQGGGTGSPTSPRPSTSTIHGEITGQTGTDAELKRLDERRTRLEGILELTEMSDKARLRLVDELKKKGDQRNEQEDYLLWLAEQNLEVQKEHVEIATQQLTKLKFVQSSLVTTTLVCVLTVTVVT